MNQERSLYEELVQIYNTRKQLMKSAADEGGGITIHPKEQVNLNSKLLGAILGLALANWVGGPSAREWQEDEGSARLKQLLTSLVGGGGGYYLGPSIAGVTSAIGKSLTGGGEGAGESKTT